MRTLSLSRLYRLTQTHTHTYIYIYIPGYSLVTNFCPGQILVWFLSSFPKCVHFKIKWPFQEKTYHCMFSCLSHVESAQAFPPFFRVFPPFSREFLPRKIMKNRHMLMQRRVRSAQEVGNTKLTTIVKKWPCPGSSQEIRTKGRNRANG